MSYSNYSVEELVADEEFIRWVKSPDEENNAFWNAWLARNPGKKEDVARAKEIILLLEVKENKSREGKFLETWGKVLERTGTPEQPVIAINTFEDKDWRRVNRWYLKIAAVAAFAVITFAGYYGYRKYSPEVISTAYGESRTLFLPDSTKVTLNANSSVTFNRLKFQDDREVWLDGEAFFAVVHKSNNQNFKVHTNELEVEVLGTRFDVNSRRGTTRVILEEGKVKLDMNRSDVSELLFMNPGDLVEVSKESKSMELKSVDPHEYSSWRNNVLEFNASPLSEIAHLIEDNYGYNVSFADPQIGERKFTGSATADDLQELTQKLSKLFNLKITQNGNEILIENQ